MNAERHNRSTPRPKPTLARRLLAAFLDGADEALSQSRRKADEQAAEDDQCRLRPDYSRAMRGYRETG